MKIFSAVKKESEDFYHLELIWNFMLSVVNPSGEYSVLITVLITSRFTDIEALSSPVSTVIMVIICMSRSILNLMYCNMIMLSSCFRDYLILPLPLCVGTLLCRRLSAVLAYMINDFRVSFTCPSAKLSEFCDGI